MEVNKPFKVICVNDGKSTQLFKGQVYMCNGVYRSFNHLRVDIQHLTHSFPIENFTLEDGSPIPRIVYFSSMYGLVLYGGTREELIDSRVICDVNNLKTLTEGKMYHISDTEHDANSGALKRVKIKESDRWYKPYNFSMLSPDIERDLNIGHVLGDNTEFDKLTDYNKTTLKRISELLSCIVNAHEYLEKLPSTELSILDVMEKRTLPKYGYTLEDFRELNEINWINHIKSRKIK